MVARPEICLESYLSPMLILEAEELREDWFPGSAVTMN